MKNTRPILKIVAVLNALLLLGGYVWYRAGRVQAEPAPSQIVEEYRAANSASATRLSSPVEVKEEAPRQMFKSSKNDIIFDAKDEGAFKPREEFIISSKGRIYMEETKANPAAPKPVKPPPPAPRSVIMSGSKSEKISIERPKTVIRPRISADEMMMSGSKSSGFISAEDLKAREARRKQAQQQAPNQKAR